MRDLTFQLLLLILIALAQPAIISNCIRQFIGTEPAKNFCLECWDGFYIKQGTCQQCNKYVKNMECSYPKYINSHSPIPANNISNTNMSLPSNNAQSKQATKPGNITSISINSSTTQIINRNYTNGSKVEIKNLPSLLKIINVIINDNDSKNNNTINRCVVYSEIENKCILCDIDYVLIEDICTFNKNVTQNSTNNLAILQVLQKSKHLLQTKNQNISKLIVSSSIRQLSNTTEDYHKIVSISDNGHDITVNVTNGLSNESARIDKRVDFVINKGDGQVKIQKIGNNDTYIIKNNSERCAEYREQKGKQKMCIRCIQGYIINKLQNHCIEYHKFMEVATDNSQIIMRKLSNNKMLRKLDVKTNNQSTFQNNNNNGSNITYDYNVSKIDVKIVRPASTPIPTFSVAEHQSIHVVLPSQNSSNSSGDKSRISDNSSNGQNATNVINITAIKMKYNLTPIIDTKTNKTMLVIGTTTNPPNKIDKCVKYREITYSCVECEIGFTLAQNKCTDNIYANSTNINNNSTATKI